MTDTNTAPPFLRFREVCDLLGMSTDSGYAHVRSGTFPVPVVKVGSILKVRRSDVDAFVNGPDNE
jgi:predicted DNA-binding transcriptional regulator AlpA